MQNEAPLMTIGTAAQLLKLSGSRVRQLADAGQLQAVRASNGDRLLYPASVHAELQRRAGRPKGRS